MSADQPICLLYTSYRADISIQRGFEALQPVVESEQALIGTDVESAVTAGDDLSVEPVSVSYTHLDVYKRQ